MNIEFQLCGFAVCVLLMTFYLSKQRLQLYSEQVFLDTMLATIVMLSLDILSVACISLEGVPEDATRFICKAYLAMLIFETSMAVLYITIDVFSEKTHRVIWGIILSLDCLEIGFMFSRPIEIFHQDAVVYSSGPSAIVTFISCGLYFLAITIACIVFRKKIAKRRLTAFSVWISIWVVAMVIQLIDPSKLLVGFAASLGMIILFVILENPESRFDSRLGVFNNFALDSYVHQLFDRQEKFHIIAVYLKQYGNYDEEVICRYFNGLGENEDVRIFKNLNMDFVILTRSSTKTGKICKELRDRQNDSSSFMFVSDIIYMDNGLDAKTEYQLPLLFQFISSKYKATTQKHFIEINEKTLADFENNSVMIGEMKKALLEDRVEVFLQPIYSSHKKKFTSAEALVRIRKPDGTLISPGLFIPVAESSGLIVELGERIFEKTCQFLSEGKVRELGVEYIEINLSVVQCEQENLAKSLIDLMEKYKIDPSWINLEITETATLNAKTKLLANMEQLIKHGVGFSLDDFGKGESNLMYIVEMPVSIVKLDYDMSKAFFCVPKAKNVVNAVVRMAHEMGISIIAEGIETREELDSMIEQDIDYIQGFYFSRPVSLPDFISFLERNNNQ